VKADAQQLCIPGCCGLNFDDIHTIHYAVMLEARKETEQVTVRWQQGTGHNGLEYGVVGLEYVVGAGTHSLGVRLETGGECLNRCA